MAYTETFAQEIGLVDKINSQSINNTNTNSLGVNMANIRRIMYQVELQSAGSAGVLNAVLQCSINSNFAGAVNLAGTSLSLNTNNNMAWTEARADQVAQTLNTTNSSAAFVRCQLIPTGNAVTVELNGYAKDCTQKPASGLTAALNASYLSSQVASTQ